MIEDKKIEEAARYYCNNRYPASQDAPFIAEGFRHGAKWAINELFKNLWHPASEEPKRHSYIMFKTTNNNGFGTEYIDCSWEILVRCLQITQWLYVDELFPKEGGEHD